MKGVQLMAMHYIGFRITDELLEFIKDEKQRIMNETGFKVSQSDVIRNLLIEAKKNLKKRR